MSTASTNGSAVMELSGPLAVLMMEIFGKALSAPVTWLNQMSLGPRVTGGGAEMRWRLATATTTVASEIQLEAAQSGA